MHEVNFRVNTKIISALTLSPLCNNTKRRLSAYWKGRSASCRNKFTLSPYFHARVGDPCISLTLFNFFASTFSQSDNWLQCSWLHCFLSQRCSDGWSPQIWSPLKPHGSNIQDWVNERGLAIYVTKSTITLFIPSTSCKDTAHWEWLLTFTSNSGPRVNYLVTRTYPVPLSSRTLLVRTGVTKRKP